MQLANNFKALRKVKVKKDVTIAEADKLAQYFGLALDKLVHMNSKVPEEVTIEKIYVSHHIKLMQQLEENKKVLFCIINSILSKSKFKDFFQKNVAAL